MPEVMGVQIGIGHNGGSKYGSGQGVNHSDLMQSLLSNNGTPTNFCRFGCEDDDLDEQGLCYHVVGISPDGKKYEPTVVSADGRRKTVCPMEKVNGKMRLVPLVIDKAKLKSGQIYLERITSSFRVYENIEKPAGLPETESDELSDEELEALTSPDDDEGVE